MPDAASQTDMAVYMNIDPVLDRLLSQHINNFEDMMLNQFRAQAHRQLEPMFFVNDAPTEFYPTFFMYDQTFDEDGTQWNWHRLYHEPQNGQLQWRRAIFAPASILNDLHRRLNATALVVD